jgi:DNA-directed RNA polymerase subunit alpha
MKMQDLEKLRTLTQDEKTASNTYGRFIAEPFDRGYGQTIGNSLRRVLLSSLEGAAISAIRIKGALHEFTALPGVKEDVANIVLNLKKIRLKMFTSGPEILHLRSTKAGVVYAKDIKENPNVEILTPDQQIATVSTSGDLEMEIEVTRGKGYVLAEETKSGKYPANTILLDALYSPITKVNYEVENCRVEQITDYDRLILEIFTDGSVTPADALTFSAKILKNTLTIFTGQDAVEESPAAAEEAEGEKANELLGQPLSIMDLSVRSANCLTAAGLTTIGELVTKDEEELLAYKNFGKRSMTEIKEKLSELGLSLGMKAGAEHD